MECASIYCENDAIAKGLCSKHHKRMRKGQDINVKTSRELTVEERFLSKINKINDGCWLWTGATRGSNGFMYGMFHLKNEIHSAHRFSWMLWKGKLAKTEERELCVCHKCDNPLCVNPEHLYIGTHKQNMQDKAVKSRYLDKMKKECKRGHEYTVKNTYISKQGLRHCRECHRIREAQIRNKEFNLC